ncbi:MAG: serine/threonine protein kinase, partial [Gemmatimonadetes bacterium]|nr:serine/threonine protein kinase [Gemmatimonadota bacterium]
MSHTLEALLLGRSLVDRYTVEAVIGRGGMSVVYRARDTRLGRPIAVKIVSLPAQDAEQQISLRERFRREAGSAARIPPHPNVVQVYDYGTDPDLDLDFIVMELLEGRDLKAAMREGDLKDAEALRAMREAARGIAAGHRVGIVHRDVKPANIFLTGKNRLESVKILDFGIAKAQEVIEEEA